MAQKVAADMINIIKQMSFDDFDSGFDNPF